MDIQSCISIVVEKNAALVGERNKNLSWCNCKNNSKTSCGWGHFKNLIQFKTGRSQERDLQWVWDEFGWVTSRPLTHRVTTRSQGVCCQSENVNKWRNSQVSQAGGCWLATHRKRFWIQFTYIHFCCACYEIFKTCDYNCKQTRVEYHFCRSHQSNTAFRINALAIRLSSSLIPNKVGLIFLLK